MAEDLILMILVGAGGLLTIGASTYGMTVLIDKVCSSPYATERVYSPVSNAAGVWGMGQEERAQVLEKVFANKKTLLTYDGDKKKKDKGDSLQQEGIEMTELKPSSKPAAAAAAAKTNVDSSTKNVDLEIGMNGTPDAVNESSPSSKENGAKDAQDPLRSNNLEPRDNACSICLAEYEKGDSVLTGTRCSHLYHKKCIMEWMQKGHDHCPTCRELMMTPQEVRAAAMEVLGPKRVDLLTREDKPIQWEQAPSTTTTTTGNANPAHQTPANPAMTDNTPTTRAGEVVIEA